MFGKVNILLLAVFGAILGVQLFWTWDGPSGATGDQAGPAASSDYAAARVARPDTATAPDPIRDADGAPLVSTSEYAASRIEPIETNAPSAVIGDASDGRAVATPSAPEPQRDRAPETGAQPAAALADSTPTSAPDAPSASLGLTITYAETLSIRFHGYREISGTYRVNDDETVSIPVIDRVSVAGLTGAELEDVLARRVFDITGRSSDVTVEVESYQQIFVSGGVQTPGSFAWRRNMTVMHAVALAGGLYRSPDRQRTSVALIDARLAIEETLAELKRAIVRSARLRAERDNVDIIEVPERLVALAGAEEARRLIESEQTLLVAARSAAALEIDAVEASLRAARDEIVRLQDFESSLRAKLEERRNFIGRMANLEDRGYVSEERMTELRTSVIDLETRLAQVRVAMSQADAARLSLERERIDIVQKRAAEVTEELVNIEALIDAKTLAFEAAIARRSELASDPDTVATGAEDASNPITYTVVRRTEYGIETMTVSEFEKLLPGDIVQVNVSRPRDDEAAGPARSLSAAHID